jgi:hypothetical protein
MSIKDLLISHNDTDATCSVCLFKPETPNIALELLIPSAVKHRLRDTIWAEDHQS